MANSRKQPGLPWDAHRREPEAVVHFVADENGAYHQTDPKPERETMGDLLRAAMAERGQTPTPDFNGLASKDSRIKAMIDLFGPEVLGWLRDKHPELFAPKPKLDLASAILTRLQGLPEGAFQVITLGHSIDGVFRVGIIRGDGHIGNTNLSTDGGDETKLWHIRSILDD